MRQQAKHLLTHKHLYVCTCTCVCVCVCVCRGTHHLPHGVPASQEHRPSQGAEQEDRTCMLRNKGAPCTCCVTVITAPTCPPLHASTTARARSSGSPLYCVRAVLGLYLHVGVEKEAPLCVWGLWGFSFGSPSYFATYSLCALATVSRLFSSILPQRSYCTHEHAPYIFLTTLPGNLPSASMLLLTHHSRDVIGAVYPGMYPAPHAQPAKHLDLESQRERAHHSPLTRTQLANVHILHKHAIAVPACT